MQCGGVDGGVEVGDDSGVDGFPALVQKISDWDKLFDTLNNSSLAVFSEMADLTSRRGTISGNGVGLLDYYKSHRCVPCFASVASSPIARIKRWRDGQAYLLQRYSVSRCILPCCLARMLLTARLSPTVLDPTRIVFLSTSYSFSNS